MSNSKKQDFRVENLRIVSSTHWKCLSCHNWTANGEKVCFGCGRPKGWLEDEEVMRKLGWIKND